MSSTTADSDFDSLGSSFASSFSLPPPSPKKQQKLDEHKEKVHNQSTESGVAAGSAVDRVVTIGSEENKDENAPSAPKQPDSNSNTQTNQEDPSAVTNVKHAADEEDDTDIYKKQYDDILAGWREESQEAREKSLSTRLRLEEEAASRARAAEDARKASIAKERADAEKAEIEEKLKAELEGPSSSLKSRSDLMRRHEQKERRKEMERKRWEDVREAWEIVKDASDEEEKEVNNVAGPSTSQNKTKTTNADALPSTSEIRSDIDQGIAAVADSRDLVAGDQGGKIDNHGPEMLERLYEATLTVTAAEEKKKAESEFRVIGTGAGPGRSTTTKTTVDSQSEHHHHHMSSSGPVADRRAEVGQAWENAAETEQIVRKTPASVSASVSASASASASAPAKPTATATPNPTYQARSIEQDAQPITKDGNKSGSPDARSTSVSTSSPSKASVVDSTTTTEKANAYANTNETKHDFPATLPEPESLSSMSNPGSPEQSPSLTLSLFTLPSRRSLLRISAALGINLVLPFINGVMLGFGEIFARESVQWTRKWWRGEVAWKSLFSRPGGKTAGVGLSGQSA